MQILITYSVYHLYKFLAVFIPYFLIYDHNIWNMYFLKKLLTLYSSALF